MSIPLRELTPEKRGAIARDYGDGTITVAAILHRHDIHQRTLYGVLRQEGSPFRRPALAAGADESAFTLARRQPRPQRLSDDALLARERALIAAATSIAERHIRALEVERVLGADSEKAARILASTTRTLGELGRRSLDCQERAAKRKRARAERFHDLTPARSPAEVREDFTRRRVEYCRGRVPGLDAP
jgi:transposase-like protein